MPGEPVKAGDLVQVLPARIGYYIVTGRTKMPDDHITVYWNLAPVCKANFHCGGPMAQKYIEVVIEGT